MVAQLNAPRPDALPLLFEPVPPPNTTSHWPGWRVVSRYERRNGERFVRNHDHDAYGAVVQHAIARYVLTDITRHDLAAELGMTPRGLQGWLSGEVWTAYGHPVLTRLAALGIGPGRGCWTKWNPNAGVRRPTEIARAAQALMERAAAALSSPAVLIEERDQLIADLRLLSVGMVAT